MNQPVDQVISFNSHVRFNDLERKILGLARDGFHKKEMPLMLGFSRSTVSRHWWIIKAKLGTRTMTETVVVAIRKGVISAYREENNLGRLLHARALR